MRAFVLIVVMLFALFVLLTQARSASAHEEAAVRLGPFAGAGMSGTATLTADTTEDALKLTGLKLGL